MLMWEICKNSADAAKEFDRTMEYVASSITTLKQSLDEGLGKWTTVSGTRAKVRRGPVGVSLLLAPFNYPLNEVGPILLLHRTQGRDSEPCIRSSDVCDAYPESSHGQCDRNEDS